LSVRRLIYSGESKKIGPELINNTLDKKNKRRNIAMAMNTIRTEIKLSVVILAKNEENRIVDCIDSVLWCDEIILVDDKSNDRTVEIVESLKNKKIKIFTRSLDNDFSKQRNFGLEKAKGEWVIFLDADEIITNNLSEEINDVIYDYGRIQKLNGYFVKRRDFMWEKELRYGETGSISLLRLAKRDAGRWMGKVHEVWKTEGNVGMLNNPIYHYPHRTIIKFLNEIDFYTDLRAQELYAKGNHVYWYSIIFYPIGKFLLNFILKRGFLDEVPGFIFAVLMSFHSFLVRGKLWLLWKKE
jgi:glycosyltransferase involved in cell wall biosynthesis